MGPQNIFKYLQIQRFFGVEKRGSMNMNARISDSLWNILFL